MRIFITEIPESCAGTYVLCETAPPTVWINPEYEVTNDEPMGGMEGCLSIPHYIGDVTRPRSIRVKASDVEGKRFTAKLEGWNAPVFLHEYDHLDGTLYLDRLTKTGDATTELYFRSEWDEIKNRMMEDEDRSWLTSHGLVVRQ